MNKILELLKDNEAVKNLSKPSSTIISSSLTVEALLVASSFLSDRRKMTLVYDNLYSASLMYDRLISLVGEENILFFPSDESFRLEAIAQSNEFLATRIQTLNELISNRDSYILICHTASIIRYISNKNALLDTTIELKVNNEFKPSLLIDKLIDCGYSRVSYIDSPMQYSTRGGVVDIYPINSSYPLRIEFFGDYIDSIREFSLETQRTVNTLEYAKVCSATDLIYSKDKLNDLVNELNDKSLGLLENEHMIEEANALEVDPPYHLIYKYFNKISKNSTNTLFDYCIDSQFIFFDVDKIIDNFNFINNENKDYFIDNSIDNSNLYKNIYDLINEVKNKTYVNSYKKSNKDIEFNVRSVESSYGNFKQLNILLDNYLKLGYCVVLALDNPTQKECLESFATEYGYSFKEFKNSYKPGLYYSYEFLKEGFEVIDNKIIYLSSLEIFGINSKTSKYSAKFKSAQKLDRYDSLNIGDYIVHENYGIGQYLGITTLEIDGVHRDYLHIQYDGKQQLDVPVESFRLIRKYVGRDGVAPRLSHIGGKEWSNTKKKIKERIKELTENLMNLYLNRTKEIGFAFPKDEEYQKEFENAFPYELTEDQTKCVEEIKKDMESNLPMDRLLCGDVGFGKTEVAFRAAFKAIVNNKQVALLCPTTLLARQHYKTALERFKNFPVSIRLVSRLVQPKEVKKIYEETSKGQVDLLIGTHKILSKKIDFKDLGLLIIDEEQRFGVEHKETIKQLRQGVDVLTLSATPIPRTLQSSLIGLRALSQIETPIENRLSVQTYVLGRDLNLAKEIIQRELGRQGQAYYIHNNIDTIYELENRLSKMLPSAKFGVIHGRMDKNEIEDVMLEFINHNIDVLISTTIIENGIDISNANTIIIDDADRFGLSQLYQLKGRVGRSERLGYCYLFYNQAKDINPVAQKRLTAIKEFSSLGSGYRIALRDLTIRGAGDILGKEQAGFIDCIGIDMYLELLQEALDEAKNGPKEVDNKSHKNLAVDAYIPKNFTDDDIDKIDIYKKINSIKNVEELIKYKDELNDVFGKIPESVELLLEKRRLELFIKESIVEDIVENNDKYEIILSKEFSMIDGIGIDIFRLVNETDRQIDLNYRDDRIRLIISKKIENWLYKANSLLKSLDLLLKEYNNEKVPNN